MDDDLPKEGELLDISKKKQISQAEDQSSIVKKSPTIIPTMIIFVVIFIAAIVFASRGIFGGNADPEQVAKYEPGAQSILGTMKGQLPYLVSVVCEGSDPDKLGCTKYVAMFRPDKENLNYAVSMGSFDKVEGVSVSDMKIIQDNLKVLVDNKRTMLSSVHAPLTFLIDSVTIPHVGSDVPIKILCTEDGVNIITCETKR